MSEQTEKSDNLYLHVRGCLPNVAIVLYSRRVRKIIWTDTYIMFSPSAARDSKTHGGRHPRRRHKRNAGGSSSDLSSEDGSTSSIRNNSEDDNNHGSGQGGHRRRLYRRRYSRHHRSSKMPWMKPEKFNGHGSFETFITQFENCSRYCGLSSEDKVAHLRWALTGTAAQLLWGTEGLSYDELLEELKCRYSGKGMEEKFQTELRCRRRNRGESLRELAQDVRRLMTLAYPGEKSSLSEHIARDSFLTALGDSELELKIREREPAGLDEALRIAQRFEVFRNAVEASTSKRQCVNRQVNDCNPDDATQLDLEERLGKLEGVAGISQLSAPMGDMQSEQMVVSEAQKERANSQTV